jgi:ubiquitin
MVSLSLRTPDTEPGRRSQAGRRRLKKAAGQAGAVLAALGAFPAGGALAAPGLWESLTGGWLATDQGWRIAIAAGLAVLTLAVVLAFGRKGAVRPLDEAPEARAGFPGPEARLPITPPGGLFPGQWYEGLDRAKLEPVLARAKKSAVAGLREALIGPDGAGRAGRPPAPEILNLAAEKMALQLNGSLASPELFEAFSGGARPDQRESSLLSLHLGQLLPPISLPRPKVSRGEVRPSAAGLTALLGAALGNFIGGAIKLPGQPAETGIFVFSAAGALIGAWLAVRLSRSERARRRLLTAVGGLAFLDALASILKGTLLPVLPGLGPGSFFRRLLFYLGAITVLVLVKSDRAFDPEGYLQEAGTRVDDYLTDALPLLAVLMYRLKESSGAGLEGQGLGVPLAGDLAHLVKRLRARPEMEKEPLFNQLVRRLETAGFETGPPDGVGPRRLEWDESLSDRYEPFGLIEKGRTVIIEEEPVIRDGKVIRRGLAAPE